ncbi:MAG: S41 family peptidase, partial [Candidatus Cloacimonetes bacterium]|nr:S41 family peptidase [Candidatus Cloacimonadota bacterium]
TNRRILRRVYIGAFKAFSDYAKTGDLTSEQFKDIMIEKYGEDVYNDPEFIDYFERLYRIPRKKYFEETIDTVTVSDLNIPGVLNAPLVVLSSSNTGSAAEDFLVNFDTTKRGTIIGSASYGSTGQRVMFPLESGGHVYICTLWSTYPDGREFINIGVQPHIQIKNTLEDLKNGVDAVMNKGLEEVRRQIEEKDETDE